MSTTLSKWRWTKRKPSVPLLPGAWPNNSSPDDLQQDIINERQKETGGHTYLYQKHQEGDYPEPSVFQGTATIPALPQAINQGKINEKSHPIALSISEDSGLMSLSEGTDASASPSDDLITPHTMSPMDTHSFDLASICNHQRPIRKSDPPSDLQDLSSQLFNLAEINADVHLNPHRRSSLHDSYTEMSQVSPVHLTLPEPFHDQELPPFELDYLESLPYFMESSTRSSTVIPVIKTPSHLVDLPSQSGMATSFYPLIDSETHGLHDSSGCASAGVITDSPVLAAEQAFSPTPICTPNHARTLRTSVILTPSSADMDVFALAASRMPASQSVVSIPTSFQSIIPVSRPRSPSGENEAEEIMFERSLAPSPSIIAFDPGCEDEISHWVREELMLNRTPRNIITPSPPVAPAEQPSFTATVSGSVVGVPRGNTNKAKGGILRRFGRRFKELFMGRASRQLVSGGIGITTTTSITSVEYVSEHPIPASEASGYKKAKAARQTSSTSQLSFRKMRHQSMPAKASSSLAISSPQRLRPRPLSFLYMDPPRDEFPRNIFHNALGLRQSMMSPSSPELRRRSTSRPSPKVQKKRGLDTNITSSIDGDIPSLNPTATGRSCAVTAPQNSSALLPKTKPRRFSLSSVFNKSNRDLLKSTLTPHPPLPAPSHECSRDTIERSTMWKGKQRADPESTEIIETRDRRQRSETMSSSRSHKAYLHERQDTVRQYNFQGASDEGARKSRNRAQSLASSHSGERHRALFDFEENLSKSRDFSLTAVGKRALGGRSFSIGHKGSKLSSLPSNQPGPSTTSTETEAVVDQSYLASSSDLGCDAYEPGLILDNMSFALKANFSDSGIASTISSVSPEPTDLPVHIQLNASASTTYEEQNMSIGDRRGDAEEREEREERSFLRALGLEFDEIVRRAGTQTS